VSAELFIDPTTEMVRGADISDDGLYRYRLWRTWSPMPSLAFIMLNPSTADAEIDDPTIRRCMNFARREGAGGIEVVNLYALRCTKPRHLLDHPDPEGDLNPMAWTETLYSGIEVVAAWGAGAEIDGLPPSLALRGFSGAPKCLGTTKNGAPRHPLYVRADQPLEDWS
jgi:hypothetical protein